MTFLLNVSLLAGLFATAGGAYVAFEALGHWTFVFVILGGGLLSWLAYRSAVEAALEYALYVRSAFDLYRNDVLARLRRPLPATPDEERRVWDAVRRLASSAEVGAARYVDDSKP